MKLSELIPMLQDCLETQGDIQFHAGSQTTHRKITGIWIRHDETGKAFVLPSTGGFIETKVDNAQRPIGW